MNIYIIVSFLLSFVNTKNIVTEVILDSRKLTTLSSLGDKVTEKHVLRKYPPCVFICMYVHFGYRKMCEFMHRNETKIYIKVFG